MQSQNEKVRQWKLLLTRAIRGGYSVVGHDGQHRTGETVQPPQLQLRLEVLLENPALVIGLIFSPDFAQAIFGTHRHPDIMTRNPEWWDPTWQVELKKLIRELAHPDAVAELLNTIYISLQASFEEGWLVDDLLSQWLSVSVLRRDQLLQIMDELVLSQWVSFDVDSGVVYLKPEIRKLIRRTPLDNFSTIQNLFVQAEFGWLPSLTEPIWEELRALLQKWPTEPPKLVASAGDVANPS